MKMMKRTLLMAAAVLALAACSDDDGPDGPQLVTETVTFEDATLNTSGILTGEKLAEEVTGDTGLGNQYSVYAKGGAKDSKKFAVGYYDSYNASQGKAGAVPTVTFSKKVNPLNIWISNSTYAFRWWTLGEGDMGGTIAPPEKVDAILSMRGYADGTLKKEVAFKLVDEEKGLVVDEWTNVDLTPLGWVDKIEFHFVCENVNAPAYFCIDDLTVATELNY